MMLLGAMLLAQGRMAGGGVLALALLPNGLGIYLWRSRREWEPYPAIQTLIGACALAAVVSVLLARASSPPTDAADPVPSLATLLIYPALMALFHLQERSARKPSA